MHWFKLICLFICFLFWVFYVELVSLSQHFKEYIFYSIRTPAGAELTKAFQVSVLFFLTLNIKALLLYNDQIIDWPLFLNLSSVIELTRRTSFFQQKAHRINKEHKFLHHPDE